MPRTGPHVAAALICERVITEGDGVLSIIRVVDRFTFSASGTAPPAEMPPMTIAPQMVIALKSDQARGRYTLKLVIQEPGGQREQVSEQDVNLKAGNQGVNIIIGMQLTLKQEGTYWIDVLFGSEKYGQEDELLTRVPFEVQYERQRIPESSRPPDAE